MSGSKRKRLPLHSNSSPVRSIHLSGKMNPIPQSQTPTASSPTDATATSTDVARDQSIPVVSAVSGLEDNNDPPESPIPVQRMLQKYNIPPGFIRLFGKLHPTNAQVQTPPPPLTDATATTNGLVVDQPIPAADQKNGPQDSDNRPQSPAPGLNTRGRPRRNCTTVDPNSVGVGFSEKKGKKKGENEEEEQGLWQAYLWFPGVRTPGRRKIGLQIFLGSYLTKEEAQDVRDRSALKLLETKGVVSPLNFHESRHAEFMQERKDWNLRDFVWQFRRHSPCFITGQSFMKGVTVHGEAGKGNSFVAKIAYTYSKEEGKVFYDLGKFKSEEKAGRAYDRALLFLRHEETEEQKLTVITNFRPSKYSESEILRAGRVNNIRKPILPSPIA